MYKRQVPQALIFRYFHSIQQNASESCTYYKTYSAENILSFRRRFNNELDVIFLFGGRKVGNFPGEKSRFKTRRVFFAMMKCLQL